MGDHIVDTDIDLRAPRTTRSGTLARAALVQPAPGPELPDSRDKAGAQTGMVVALTAGGLFWAAVGAAAIYFLGH